VHSAWGASEALTHFRSAPHVQADDVNAALHSFSIAKASPLRPHDAVLAPHRPHCGFSTVALVGGHDRLRVLPGLSRGTSILDARTRVKLDWAGLCSSLQCVQPSSNVLCVDVLCGFADVAALVVVVDLIMEGQVFPVPVPRGAVAFVMSMCAPVNAILVVIIALRRALIRLLSACSDRLPECLPHPETRMVLLRKAYVALGADIRAHAPALVLVLDEAMQGQMVLVCLVDLVTAVMQRARARMDAILVKVIARLVAHVGLIVASLHAVFHGCVLVVPQLLNPVHAVGAGWR